MTVAVIIASFIFGPGVWIPYLKGVGVASAFFFGIAAWNGYQSHRRGGNFWETFKNHVNDNWAMSLAFAGLILAPMVGMKIAKAAKVKAAKKQPLPSVAQPQNSDLFRVGIYDELPIIEGMNRHHVGQGAVMKKLIPGYNYQKAPAIIVPAKGHRLVAEKVGTVSKNTKGFTNARQVIARDILELRRVYGNIPNSALRSLIDLNKAMFGL